MTAEQNILESCFHKNCPLLASQIQHATSTAGSSAIAKSLITEINAQMRKRWCNDNKT
jgi:hypothetical protein